MTQIPNHRQGAVITQAWGRSLLITILAYGWHAVYTTCASAEGFFDLYGGLSLSEKTNAVAQDFLLFTTLGTSLFP